MRRKLTYIAACLLFLAGMAIMLYPSIRETLAKLDYESEIKAFNSDEKLVNDMKAYNEALFADRQSGPGDPWTEEEPLFDTSSLGTDDGMIAYLTIDAMDLRLPVYLGASEENLAKGAAVLSRSSMPTGGESTNCVIAAHRGYKGIPMFREIERLQPGDIVELTTPWGTLKYEMVKSVVVSPDQSDAVHIVEGEDLLTLVTCHPYTVNTQRYIVYCQRVVSGAGQNSGTSSGATNSSADLRLPSYSEVPYVSSEGDIDTERSIRLVLAAAFAAAFVVTLALSVRKKPNKKK